MGGDSVMNLYEKQKFCRSKNGECSWIDVL